MKPKDLSDLSKIARQFKFQGELLTIKPYGSGHIHDTYLVETQDNQSIHAYILQKINAHVFKNPEEMMENIARVVAHQKSKMLWSRVDQIERKSLTIVHTKDEQLIFKDNSHSWRAFIFIAKSYTLDKVQTPQQAYTAANSFGHFLSQLTDLPGDPLIETIPSFHDTRKRLNDFKTALDLDLQDRANSAKPEIETILQNSHVVHIIPDLMKSKRIPERIVHNDTKINNLLIDKESHDAICVIDLDTVMVGSALFDFGDLMRTASTYAAEDEQQFDNVKMEMELFRALITGYYESTNETLTSTEVELLPFSGVLITYEIGLRFLTDYLLGDQYFKIQYSHHNLDRCRSQLVLMKSMLIQLEEMNRFVQKVWI